MATIPPWTNCQSVGGVPGLYRAAWLTLGRIEVEHGKPLPLSSRSIWLKHEGVLGWAGEERGGFHVHPGFVARPVVGREEVTALTAWHVKDPPFFMTGRNNESFRRPKARTLNPRHVVVTRQRDRDHVEVGSEFWDRPADGMLDSGSIAGPPGRLFERDALPFQVGEDLVQRTAEKGVVRKELGVEKMARLGFHKRPERMLTSGSIHGNPGRIET